MYIPGAGVWGGGGGRRVPSLYPSHSFSTAICLCLPPPPPSPCHLDVVLFFISLFSSSSLSLIPLLPSPHHPSSLALSWASVQLNLYTLCTHNQPNENPTANTLSAGWSASVLRRGGAGWGRGGMGRVWNLECGFSRALEGGWAGVTVFHYVLLCNKLAHPKT